MRSDARLKRWYKKINHKFFKDELPTNVCVRYMDETDEDEVENCEKKFYGWASPGEGIHKYQIVISRPKNPGDTAKCATLVHEMCHIATGLRDGHGPSFEAQRQLVSDRGIFKKNAIFSGLTLF